MGIVFRQSAKNSIVTAAGAILGAAIIWLSTKYIAKRELGFLGNFTNYAVTLSQVLLFGLNNTLNVYIHQYANDARKKKLLITLCMVLPGIIALVAGVIYLFLRTWILAHFQPEDQPFMERYFIWLPVFTVMFIYMVILEQYLGSQLKVAVSGFMREVLLRIANIALILLFAFSIVDFNALVIGTILIYLLPLFILSLLAIKTKDFGLSFQFGDFSRGEYKEMLHFSWYHFLLVISVILIGSLDALLLPFYDHRGFGAVAVYRVAVFFISFLQLPLKALIPASFTVLARAFADNDRPKAADLFLRSSINIFIPTLFIAAVICCNLQNIVLLIQEGYSEIAPVFLILFIGCIANVATGMNDQVLSITKYYRFNFYLSLILVIVLFFLIKVFVPRYGVIGAAWSTTATIIVFNTIKCFFVWKKLQMLPFSRGTVLTIVAALPAFAAGYLLPHFINVSRGAYVHIFADAFLRCVVITVTYFFMLLWLRPSADMEEYLASVRKSKRLF